MGLLVALSIVIPTCRAGDLMQWLGIGGVAIGFAFHDILQNFLAGILLLLTEPFRIGDQIIVRQFEGTDKCEKCDRGDVMERFQAVVKVLEQR